MLQFWRHPLPAFSAAAAAAAIFLWPAAPLVGLESWFLLYVGTPYLLVLYPIVAILSGVFVGLIIHHKTVAPSCAVGGGKIGAAGSAMGVFFGVCPACIPVVAVFLPLAFNVFLSRVAPYMSLAAIAILLFAIYRMNGFRRAAGSDMPLAAIPPGS